MHWVVPLMLLAGALLIFTPFVAGATLSNRHEKPRERNETSTEEVPSGMAGYVAPELSPSQTFFEEDPLDAHSLPDRLDTPHIADGVTLELIQTGTLPPSGLFPVDAIWKPWGYELPEDERGYPFQLELELPHH